jgi:hypothetical protein
VVQNSANGVLRELGLSFGLHTFEFGLALSQQLSHAADAADRCSHRKLPQGSHQ